jgi:hypothetical protein
MKYRFKLNEKLLIILTIPLGDATDNSCPSDLIRNYQHTNKLEWRQIQNVLDHLQTPVLFFVN